MTTATQANVTKLYIATFGRAPDGAGLNYWVNQSGLSLEDIAKSFFDQPETQAKFGTSDNASFVAAIYQNVLGRAGEAGGVAYWISQLESGALTRDNIILAVLGGATGSDATLLENRTESGLTFALIGTGSPDAFAVINETTAAAESVAAVKEWIMGKTPAETPPSQYKVLDDNRTDYNLTGSAKDDVFVIEAFKTANIKGAEGSDTLDFQDYSPAGITVNLSTGLGPNGMKVEWVENVRGTSGVDTLTGNSDANILISMGGADKMDGGVGNDRLMYNNVEDVAASTMVNGGQNQDELWITEQTAITVKAATFNAVSDIEVLQVGFDEEGVASATTITVEPTVTSLNKFKEIRGTQSFDKKGNATNDVIQSAGSFDVSGVKLTSIEELKDTSAAGTVNTITIGKDTLTSVKKVTGNAGGDTILDLKAKDGDVFDLTMPTFTKIDNVTQNAGGTAAKSTIIVNQSLIESLAANSVADAAILPTPTRDGFDGGNFTQSTLKASGIGLDLSVLDDGDTLFKALDFGTAKEVTIGDLTPLVGTLKTITGSENNADLLRVKPDLFAATQDLTAIKITKVERLDFEETGAIIMNNDSIIDVTQISGDDDKKQADGTDMPANPGHLAVLGTVINVAPDATTTKRELDLTDIKLEDIVGFGDGANDAKILINSGTILGSAFASLDIDSDQVLVSKSAGSYDLSTIKQADATVVDFAAVAPAPVIAYTDKFVGGNYSEIVKGAETSMGYDLGGQDDQFIGTNTANEVVVGGDGNDTIALGDNKGAVAVITNRADFVDALEPAGPAGAYYGIVSGNNPVTATPNFLDVDGLGDPTDPTTGVAAEVTFGAYADGGNDDDVITSGVGHDVLIGGNGNDSISAGDGNDILSGGAGADILSGGKGNDIMAGGAGDDVLEGNAGEDVLYGGKGKDALRGDELVDGKVAYLSRDHFVFDAGDSGTTESTVDAIKDLLVASVANDPANTDLLNKNDVMYFNWFASDTALAASGGPGSIAAIGTSYAALVTDVGAAVSTKGTLLQAADAALDAFYKAQYTTGALLNTAGNAETMAVQFEYGGAEYLVIDALVTANATSFAAGQAANNYNVTNDLIVQISDTVVDWSVDAADLVVTRWEATVV